MPWLVQQGKGRREFELQDRTIIGRGRDCHIKLDDPLVSRHHVEIRREGEKYFIKDLGSRNGSKLNGQRLTEAELHEFDRITMGSTRLFFYVLRPRNWKGEVIGGCEVQEPIGAGASGTVYKALQISMERIVAIKILNERYCLDKEFIRRFLEEARLAGRLEHPNVIRVYDVGEAKGAFYYTMEYVNGSSLAELVKERGAIRIGEAVEIIKRVALALDYAHRQGVLHRDVKPANILVNLEGEVKLADLGLARPVDEITEEKAVGTPLYMSPEQILGKEVSPRSDLYSLGATFYFALSGTPPHSGSTKKEVFEKQLWDDPIPIEQLRPEVPPAVSAVVHRLLAKRVEDRYPTARSVVDALNEIGQFEKPEAPTPHPLLADKEMDTTNGPPKKGATKLLWAGALILELAAAFAAFFFLGRWLARWAESWLR